MNENKYLQKYIDDFEFVQNIDDNTTRISIYDDQIEFYKPNDNLIKKILNYQLDNNQLLSKQQNNEIIEISDGCIDFTLSVKRKLIIYYDGCLKLQDMRSKTFLNIQATDVQCIEIYEDLIYTLGTQGDVKVLNLQDVKSGLSPIIKVSIKKPLKLQVQENYLLINSLYQHILIDLSDINVKQYICYSDQELQLFQTNSKQIFIIDYRNKIILTYPHLYQLNIKKSTIFCQNYFIINDMLFKLS